jgi:hypothetical protein
MVRAEQEKGKPYPLAEESAVLISADCAASSAHHPGREFVVSSNLPLYNYYIKIDRFRVPCRKRSGETL